MADTPTHIYTQQNKQPARPWAKIRLALVIFSHLMPSFFVALTIGKAANTVSWATTTTTTKNVMKCFEELHFHEVKHGEQDKNFQYVEAYLSSTTTVSQSKKDALKALWKYTKEMSRKRREADCLEGRRRGTAVEEEVAAFQIISLSFPSSLGQQEDVYQGDVIISGSACFLLATPWQAVQPGRVAWKTRHLPIV